MLAAERKSGKGKMRNLLENPETPKCPDFPDFPPVPVLLPARNVGFLILF
jgi:hypothetical protein